MSSDSSTRFKFFRQMAAFWVFERVGYAARDSRNSARAASQIFLSKSVIAFSKRALASSFFWAEGSAGATTGGFTGGRF